MAQISARWRGAANFMELRPCLMDKVHHTPFDPHYFYQAAWMARRLVAANPPLHIDVGSSIGIVAGYLGDLRWSLSITGRCKRGYRDFALSAAISRDCLSPMDPCAHFLHCMLSSTSGLAAMATPLILWLIPSRCANSTGFWRPADTSILRRRSAESVFVSMRTVYLRRGPSCRTLSDLKLDSFDLVDDSGAFTGAVDLARAEQLDYGCGMFAFVKARPVRAGGT